MDQQRNGLFKSICSSIKPEKGGCHNLLLALANTAAGGLEHFTKPVRPKKYQDIIWNGERVYLAWRKTVFLSLKWFQQRNKLFYLVPSEIQGKQPWNNFNGYDISSIMAVKRRSVFLVPKHTWNLYELSYRQVNNATIVCSSILTAWFCPVTSNFEWKTTNWDLMPSTMVMPPTYLDCRDSKHA